MCLGGTQGKVPLASTNTKQGNFFQNPSQIQKDRSLQSYWLDVLFHRIARIVNAAPGPGTGIAKKAKTHSRLR